MRRSWGRRDVVRQLDGGRYRRRRGSSTRKRVGHGMASGRARRPSGAPVRGRSPDRARNRCLLAARVHERLEDAFPVVGRDGGTDIADRDLDVARGLAHADRQRRTGRREAQPVLDEGFRQDPRHPARVCESPDGRPSRRVDLQSPRRTLETRRPRRGPPHADPRARAAWERRCPGGSGRADRHRAATLADSAVARAICSRASRRSGASLFRESSSRPSMTWSDVTGVRSSCAAVARTCARLFALGVLPLPGRSERLSDVVGHAAAGLVSSAPRSTEPVSHA